MRCKSGETHEAPSQPPMDDLAMAVIQNGSGQVRRHRASVSREVRNLSDRERERGKGEEEKEKEEKERERDEPLPPLSLDFFSTSSFEVRIMATRGQHVVKKQLQLS